MVKEEDMRSSQPGMAQMVAERIIGTAEGRSYVDGSSDK